MVSGRLVWRTGYLGHGFGSSYPSHQFLFFKIEETCTFINDFQLEISSKCDIKAENSSTLCKNHKGRKGLSTDVNEFHFSRAQNQKSRSSVFLYSETERKRLLRRLMSCFLAGHKCFQERTNYSWSSQLMNES